MSSEINLNDMQPSQAMLNPTLIQKMIQISNFSNPTKYIIYAILGLGAIAVMIVVSLLPTYIPTSDTVSSSRGRAAFYLSYATNVRDSSLPNVDTAGLSTKMTNALQLTQVTVQSAQLVAPMQNTGKKRRATQDYGNSCQSVLNNNLLIMSILVDYPRESCPTSCQQRFISTVTNNITTLFANIRLSVTLVGGRSLDVQLSICSLTQASTPPCSTTCANGGTCISQNICLCATGWSGSTCTTAVCAQTCMHGGTCTAPNYCTCASGYSGSDCSAGRLKKETQSEVKVFLSLDTLQTTNCHNDEIKILLFLFSGGCHFGKDKVRLIGGGERAIENLKVGDRIWSIGSDGNSYIEDEIMIMADNGPNKTTLFYTMKTINGYEVSLTDRHFIPIFDPVNNQINVITASQVKLSHRLIIFSDIVAIKNISTSIRLGFYAPITLSGYLLVNNISTSVFVSRFGGSAGDFQHAFTPIRLYYKVMRWYFGREYHPFETNLKEGEHPFIHSLKQYAYVIKSIFLTIKYIFPTVFVIGLFRHLSQMALAQSLYLHLKKQIRVF